MCYGSKSDLVLWRKKEKFSRFCRGKLKTIRCRGSMMVGRFCPRCLVVTIFMRVVVEPDYFFHTNTSSQHFGIGLAYSLYVLAIKKKHNAFYSITFATFLITFPFIRATL